MAAIETIEAIASIKSPKKPKNPIPQGIQPLRDGILGL